MTDVFEAESTIEQWDRDYYHPIARHLYDRAVADMLDVLAVGPDGAVLDAGCGTGVHSVRAAAAGHRVCAVDASEAMLREASHHVAQAGLTERVELQRQDLTHLGFADGSFRCAFSWGVVIHIPEARAALDELARILQPGGRLALYITNRSALDHRVEAFARWLLRRPLTGLQHHEFGDGIWYELDGRKLWVWRLNVRAVIDHFAGQGLVLVHRRIGELTEHQRRLKGLPRALLLRANNAAWRLRLPARWGATSLCVFEKQAGPAHPRPD